MLGAKDGTWTHTSLLTLEPESSASANSATLAYLIILSDFYTARAFRGGARSLIRIYKAKTLAFGAVGGTWTPTSLRTLAPEDTIFVHITSCKMNRTSIKLDFCAEYALVWWKNAIINTEKFEKKPAGNRYILVENLFCRGIFAWKYNLLDTY